MLTPGLSDLYAREILHDHHAEAAVARRPGHGPGPLIRWLTAIGTRPATARPLR